MTRAVHARLGDRLIERGLLSEEKLALALKEQQRAHRPLGVILVSLGFVGAEQIARLVAEDLGLEYVAAADISPDPLIVSALDADFVRESRAFPWALEDGLLKVAMVDPEDSAGAELVRARFPYALEIGITTERELAALQRDHVRARTSRVGEVLAAVPRGEAPAPGALSVEALAEAVVLDGLERGATDVHIEPEDRVTRVRYRVDGILQPGESLPVEATAAIVSRIKVQAKLDISERRRPQDGRLQVGFEGRDVDLRVSVMPCAFGENVVLRVLDRAGGELSLPELGISRETQRLLTRITSRTHGLFLVTGPTSSGKTTTLYAMLSTIDAMAKSVATIEDPIEYRLPLLRQSQVDSSIGYTFHAGLRALLRQDPDVILVGEIRDRETADMAVKAAMTGHLVLSTLHTNSALAAIPRLIDIGVEPYRIEDTLIGVLSQRLVRKVCPACAEYVPATAREVAWLGESVATLMRGAGCGRCDQTGYHGRTAMVELFLPDASLADALRRGAPLHELEELARPSGFRTMIDDGRRLVLGDVTTIDEVLRVHTLHRLSPEEREDL